MAPGGPSILHVFPGFDPGGAQMRTVQLMEMLPSSTRHVVLALNGHYACADLVPDDLGVECLPAPPRRSFLGMGRYMADLIGRQQPDLVLTYNWGSIEAVLGARRHRHVPLIHHEDGFGPEEAQRYLRRRIWARRFLLPRAVAVAVPSRTLRDLAVERWRLAPERVHYLPNGVDLERFRPQPGHDRRAEPVIGHVGHLRPEKNQRMLLHAFAACRQPCSLRVIGDGDEASGLRKLATELGVADRVIFTGSVEDTAPVYGEMDVFALSSDTEQMPLTVLEAMASGLPVVSTDVGDVRSMLAPQNREYLGPRGDPTALAANLDRLLGDPELRGRVGSANRDHCAAEFGHERCHGAWVELYGRFLAAE